MIGTTKCPQVRPAISVANIYCHELAMRVFNNQLKATEIETESYLNPAVSRSNELVHLCEIEVPVLLHCPETITHSNATFGTCAKVDSADARNSVQSNYSLIFKPIHY